VNRSPRDRQDRFRSYSRVVRTAPLAWHTPTTEDEGVAARTAATTSSSLVGVCQVSGAVRTTRE
jgi:hypothetical protein